MLVREVMVKQVRSAKPGDSVRSVAGIICTNRISGLPVVDDDNNLIGLISEKDILNTLLPSYSDFLEDPIGARDFVAMEKSYSEILSKDVASLMTRKLFTVGPDDPVMKAASQMAIHNFRRIPVVDKGKLVGVLSLGDIHKAIFQRELDK
ncbi:MAG: CBS domain-containing protein [Magnetococcales bacterium]|nr:CBS domain-containing protein [Magnetococcales bacterium]